MQRVAYFKDGNKNIVYEIMDKQARDDIAVLPKNIIDKVTSPFTSTGSIIQCNPVEGYPLDVAVNLAPIQSGSGDPYPAGGGANLLNTSIGQTSYKQYVTIRDDGRITINNTSEAQIYPSGSYYSLSAGTYAFQTDVTADIQLYLQKNSGDYSNQLTKDKKLVVVSIAEGESVSLMASVPKGINATFAVWLTAGSTATPYAPYANIRPISGHTDCEVVRAGKNLLPKVVAYSQEKNGITLTSYGDGSYRVHGTCTAGGTSLSFSTESTAVIPKGAYWHLLNDGTCTNAAFAPKFTDGTTGSLAFSVKDRIYQVSSSSIGKTIKEIGVYVVNGETLDITFRPMMCLDDIATAYEPYQADTYFTALGNNLFKASEASSAGNRINITNGAQVTVANNQRASGYIAVEPNTQYVLNFRYYSGGDFGMAFYNSGKTFISGTKQNLTGTEEHLDKPFVFTTPANCAYLRFSTSDKPDLSKIVLLKGSGMYGGTVDVSEGETVSEWGVKTLDGTERYIHVSSWSDGAYQIENYLTDAPTVDGYANIAELACSHAKTEAPQYIVGGRIGIGQGSGNNLYLNFGSQYNTSDSIKAYLAALYAAGTPVQVAYKLANPTTLTTTAHDIPALKGTNTVYADAGEVTVNGRIDPDYLNNNLLERIAALEAAALNN